MWASADNYENRQDLVVHIINDMKTICSHVEMLKRYLTLLFALSNYSCFVFLFCETQPVVDPGFSKGGHAPVRRGRGPLTWALFSENVCENKRIGSHGGRALGMPPLDPPMPTIFSHLSAI